MNSKRNIGQEILDGLEEALLHARGERDLPTWELPAPPVQAIRERIGLTQREFATLIKVSPRTVENWEQGHRRPSGPAAVLLHLIEANPGEVLKAIQRF